MNFDQILTKSDQILTIYVKNHSIHVENVQERHFLKIKQSTSKIIQKKNPSSKINHDFGYWGIGGGGGGELGYWGGGGN